MQTTLNTKLADDPHDVLVVASDATPVAPVDDADPITPTEEALSRLAQTLREAPTAREAPTLQALPEPEFVMSPIVPPVDTSFRPVVDDVEIPTMTLPPVAEARPLRGFAVALLFALGASGAAMAWQVFGDSATHAVTRWMPHHVLAALPLNPSVAAEPTPAPTVEAVAAPAASSPPASAATTAATAAAPDPAPSLRAMGQQIDELKASIEQLKASQQQMSRELAMATERANEASLTPRAPAPRPAVARVRKPVAPTQTAAVPRLSPVVAAPVAAPYVPPPPVAAQPQVDAPVSSAPRPPMPIQ